MKQKTITTGVCELFVCELHYGAKNIRIETNQLIIPYPKIILYEIPATEESYGYEETEGFDLPQGNWQPLGAVCDVSEEQADRFVDKSIYTGLYGYYVKDIPLNTYCYKNALESFNTLLTANGVYFENPCRIYIDVEKRSDNLMDWHKAQDQVWDKERTYLFKKMD